MEAGIWVNTNLMQEVSILIVEISLFISTRKIYSPRYAMHTAQLIDGFVNVICI